MSNAYRIQHLCNLADLRESWKATQARHGKAGVDGVTPDMFARQAEECLTKWASGELPAPQAAMGFDIPKSRGVREVVRLTVQDRVLEGAAMRALSRVLTPLLHPNSFAYRAGRGALDAVTRVAESAKAGLWVVRLDVRECFSSIPQDLLQERLTSHLSERASGELKAMLRRPVKKGRLVVQPERGLLEGSLLSPLLSNWYLLPLDEVLAQGGAFVVRYADDVVALVSDPVAAAHLVERAHQALHELKLDLNDSKTKVGPVEGSFDFLGFTFTPGSVRIAPDRLEAVKQEVQERLRERDVNAVQQLLQGWQAYYRVGQVADDLKLLDAWLAAQEGAPRLKLNAVSHDGYTMPRPKTHRPALETQAEAPKAADHPVTAAMPQVKAEELALIELARTLAAQAHPAAHAAALLALRWPADPAVKLEHVLVAVKAAARSQIRQDIWPQREAACERLRTQVGLTGRDTVTALKAERLVQECIDPLLRAFTP